MRDPLSSDIFLLPHPGFTNILLLLSSIKMQVTRDNGPRQASISLRRQTWVRDLLVPTGKKAGLAVTPDSRELQGLFLWANLRCYSRAAHTLLVSAETSRHLCSQTQRPCRLRALSSQGVGFARGRDESVPGRRNEAQSINKQRRRLVSQVAGKQASQPKRLLRLRGIRTRACQGCVHCSGGGGGAGWTSVSTAWRTK